MFSENFINQVSKHFDSATAFYFQNELTAELPKIIDTIYAELNGPKLVPVKNSTVPGQQFVKYYTYDTFGRPDYITDLSNDLPSVSANAKVKQYPVFRKGVAVRYSVEDEIVGTLANRSLLEQLIKAAIRSHAQDTNQMMFFGDSTVPGWINNPDLDKSVVANGADGSPLWDNKTPDEILKDLNDAITEVLDQSNNTHKVTTIALSLKSYRLLQETRLGAALQATLLEQFIANNPGVNVVPANELKNAFTNDSNGFVAYVNNGDNFWYEMDNMKMTDVFRRSLFEYEMGYLKTHGGVQIITPKSQIIKYGI
jgi:hypothetical protein